MREEKSPVLQYIEAYGKLAEVRSEYGEDSPEEEAHLEKMDSLWYALSSEELDEVEGLLDSAKGGGTHA